ncbi:EF-hand domain-containing protein [Maricaulis sp. CAU 1757]
MTPRFVTTALLATSMLALATTAHAQPGGQHRGGADRGQQALMLLRAADSNADNSVTREELDALQTEMFAWMDRNGDGFLDEADQSPVRRRLAELREDDGEEGRRHRRGRGERPSHLRADSNEDNRISRAEFMASQTTMFERLDADGNGVISPDELDAAVEDRRDRGFWWRD